MTAAEDRRCAVCGADLAGRSRTAKYCGRSCQRRAARTRLGSTRDGPVTTAGAARVTWPALVIAAMRADPKLADLADRWAARLLGGHR